MKFLLLILPFLFLGCSHCPCKNKTTQAIKPSVILIHGSHFDSQTWSFVEPALSEKYSVRAINLLDRGGKHNVSLNDMAKDVCAHTASPSAFVGHSFGGAVINEMVGICPEKISKIIYVTAVVPLKGEKPFDAMATADQTHYSKGVRFGKKSITPKDPAHFYQMMDEGVDLKNLPKLKIYAESYAAGKNPIQYDVATFEKIPKYYIFASQDKVITPKIQNHFVERTQMKDTATLPSGHLPTLTHSAELTQILEKFL